MREKPQIWLRTRAAGPRERVFQVLTDTSSYAYWWPGTECRIDQAEGSPTVGTWFGITSIDRRDRRRTYAGQVLQAEPERLTFTWRGRARHPVRVTLCLDESADRTSTCIDFLISGIPSGKAARTVRREWVYIARSLSHGWAGGGKGEVLPPHRTTDHAQTGFLSTRVGGLSFHGLSEYEAGLAREFSQQIGASLVTTASILSRGQLDIGHCRSTISRSLDAGNLLVASATPSAVLFCFDLFEWLKELVGSLFDDKGLDVAIGTIEGPEGSPTHGGIGLEINIPPNDGGSEAPKPQPAQPSGFEPPPKEPRIKLKLMFIYNLDSVTNSFRPPAGFPSLDDLTFPTPAFDPGESGFGFGIEFKF